MTRVRITVRAGEVRIVREGCGAGESNAASPGQAHEFAAKEAETDANKPALSTFGNARWSLDFVHDQMATGWRLRVLDITDDVTPECLDAIPDTSISGHRVVRELTAIVAMRGKPGLIVSDNGEELTSHAIFASPCKTVVSKASMARCATSF